MKLIVGLGNPGKKYVNNRHNLGYMVMDRVVAKRGLVEYRDDADLMCFFVKDDDAAYIKPTTFMNESGNSVRAVCNFFKINPKDILVIYDELDLEFGKIKLSFNGSSAGHRGVDSVIEGAATMDFARLRIGIGHPSHKASDGKYKDSAEHVLEDFLPEEKGELNRVLDLAVEAAESYLSDGITATMNRFN